MESPRASLKLALQQIRDAQESCAALPSLEHHEAQEMIERLVEAEMLLASHAAAAIDNPRFEIERRRAEEDSVRRMLRQRIRKHLSALKDGNAQARWPSSYDCALQMCRDAAEPGPLTWAAICHQIDIAPFGDADGDLLLGTLRRLQRDNPHLFDCALDELTARFLQAAAGQLNTPNAPQDTGRRRRARAWLAARSHDPQLTWSEVSDGLFAQVGYAHFPAAQRHHRACEQSYFAALNLINDSIAAVLDGAGDRDISPIITGAAAAYLALLDAELNLTEIRDHVQVSFTAKQAAEERAQILTQVCRGFALALEGGGALTRRFAAAEEQDGTVPAHPAADELWLDNAVKDRLAGPLSYGTILRQASWCEGDYAVFSENACRWLLDRVDPERPLPLAAFWFARQASSTQAVGLGLDPEGASVDRASARLLDHLDAWKADRGEAGEAGQDWFADWRAVLLQGA